MEVTDSIEIDANDAENSENENQLPYDVVFGLLANERRRRVLSYLTECKNSTLGDLADHIASLENGKPIRSVSSVERKRVYVGLYQCHLPKMDDANVIDYDQSRGTIELRPEADQVLHHLPNDEKTTSTETSLGISVPFSLGARLRNRVPV